LKNFPVVADKFTAGMERMLPESGWVHGRDIPSLADICCFHLSDEIFKDKFDYTKYPKFTRIVEAIKKVPGAYK